MSETSRGLSRPDWETFINAHELTHVGVGCVDWEGRLRSKQYASEKILASAQLPITSAVFTGDPVEQPITTLALEDPANGYPDALINLDEAVGFKFPFDHGGDGLIMLGCITGDLADHCPRSMLQKELGRWQRIDRQVRGAFEIESYLLRETTRSMAGKSPEALCFSEAFARMMSFIEQSDASEFLNSLTSCCEVMGIKIRAVHGEHLRLLETALAPAQGVTICDHALLYKSIAKIVARRQHILASFMAQASAAAESAGAHLNLSFADGIGRSTLVDGDDLLLSDEGRFFIGGLQRYLPELMVCLAPNINSYKRFVPPNISPLNNTWDYENKTAAYRVAGSGADRRIEIRVPGADTHPYLALTAVLTAGRRGIGERAEPSAPSAGNAWSDSAPSGPPWPRDLSAAVSAWRGSALAKSTFGASFVEAYALTREWQLAAFARAVTDWELQTYAYNA
ncbi:MAG: hypothetical protein AAF384_09005 [Pseudomonadota bacterium]